MTSDTQSARDDLAFLRSLVDEDWRPGAWAFGAIYVSLGAALVAHVLISWAAAEGYLPLRGVALIATYVVLYTAASFVWTWIGGHARRAAERRGAQGAGVKGRASGAALVSAFVGHLVMLVVLVIVAVRQQNGVFLELA